MREVGLESATSAYMTRTSENFLFGDSLQQRGTVPRTWGIYKSDLPRLQENEIYLTICRC